MVGFLLSGCAKISPRMPKNNQLVLRKKPYCSGHIQTDISDKLAGSDEASMLRKPSQKGFTLVELIVAIVIIGFMVTGITSLYIAVEKTQSKTRMLETATRAGEKKIEELRNSHYSALQNGSTINFTNELPNTLPSPRSGTVAVSEPIAGIKRVDLNITYKDGNSDRKVELSSMIGVLGIGQ